MRPGWELREWTDANVAELFPLVNQRIYDEAESLCPNHVGQLRSDVLRYEILQRFGGVYVDADFECLRPIDPLLEGVECFAAWVTPRWVNNAIMGATPGHRFIDRLVGGLAANVKRNRGRRPNWMSGPHFLTAVARQHPREVTLFGCELFYPVHWNQIELRPGEIDPAERWPKAYGMHWWANQRREKGVE